MPILRIVSLLFSVGMLVLSAGMASGQPYPNKPIRVVTSKPGGSTDLIARIIGQGISGALGQPVMSR